MQNEILVSVITPCYNAALFLPRVIESVRCQQFSLEHIIVDDCSSDSSTEVLDFFSKKYDWIRVVRLDQNSGPVVARNIAISLANGRYLAFLDADDYWLPDKLKIQIPFMQNHNSGISYTDYRHISQNSLKIGRRIRGPSQVGFHLHHATRYLGCLTVVIDRDKYASFKFPNISPAYRAEDFLGWADFMKITGCNAVRCPYDLARYTLTQNSRSSNKLKASLSVWNLYRFVENIPVAIASFYFLCYVIFSTWKSHWHHPYFNNESVDPTL